MDGIRPRWLLVLAPALCPAVAGAAGVAVADLATTNEAMAVQVAVLANDTGFSYPASVAIETQAGSGTAVVSGSPGSPGTVLVTYTPAPGFQGTDTFVYSVTDGLGTSSATVAVSVLADTDADGMADAWDNCTTLPNNAGLGAQCDSDGDGVGNRCDGDLSNNGATNAQDTVLFRQQLGQPSPAPGYNMADINCNGAVNS